MVKFVILQLCLPYSSSSSDNEVNLGHLDWLDLRLGLSLAIIVLFIMVRIMKSPSWKNHDEANLGTGEFVLLFGDYKLETRPAGKVSGSQIKAQNGQPPFPHYTSFAL